ncbi:protocatechuate 3,4-dioxygenase [Aquincola sp. J276]|uniref:protocatechuate 3,4-dioxygenase n=1 Tax=Aquincola sp. J276 TaxID=2898432 RepID=UPI0021512FA1|nr:protocatechuate 3,4-dioxygenase [Aquincola sp. J276]MCR5868894.1 protocatechuate 3,4-dioxygenase [Aquincola sp. J276]
MPSPALPRRRLALAAASLVACPALLRPVWAQGRQPPTPRQTEGPFYPPAFDGDADADLLDRGGRRYAQGQPAWLQGQVLDTTGRVLDGATVEIWQCDHAGRYRHPGDGDRADTAFQGYGRMVVGADGRYRFRTIRPVAYAGRTPHIHVKVLHGRRELLTTQLYVQGDPGNARDFLWRSLDESGRAALTRPFVAGSGGLEADFPLVIAA